MLRHQIDQGYPFPRVKADIEFVVGNLDLLVARNVLDRSVEQIEIAIDRNLDARQAAITTRFQLSVEVTA